MSSSSSIQQKTVTHDTSTRIDLPTVAAIATNVRAKTVLFDFKADSFANQPE